MDLDGVAAAERDGSGAVAIEEFVIGRGSASGALGVAGGRVELADASGPDVDGGESAIEFGGFADQDFQGGGDLEGSDEGGESAEDAGGVAGGLGSTGRVAIEATEASGLVGKDGEGESVGADGGAVDPGDVAGDGVVVDEIAGFEVIGAVQDEVGRADEFFDVGGGDVAGEGVDGDLRVDAGELEFRGGGFGKGLGGVVFGEEPLALEIGGFNEVAIEDGEVPDAGAGESGGVISAESAAADDGDAGGEEAGLAFGADAGEENLAGIAVQRGRLTRGGEERRVW